MKVRRDGKGIKTWNRTIYLIMKATADLITLSRKCFLSMRRSEVHVTISILSSLQQEVHPQRFMGIYGQWPPVPLKGSNIEFRKSWHTFFQTVSVWEVLGMWHMTCSDDLQGTDLSLRTACCLKGGIHPVNGWSSSKSAATLLLRCSLWIKGFVLWVLRHFTLSSMIHLAIIWLNTATVLLKALKKNFGYFKWFIFYFHTVWSFQ